MVKETKMKDMGKKMSKTDTLPSVSNKIVYPTLRLNDTQLPEIGDYVLDDEVELKVIGKVKELSKNNYGENKNVIYCTLEIQKVSVINIKEDRITANRMGIDKQDFEELKKKREDRNKKSNL